MPETTTTTEQEETQRKGAIKKEDVRDSFLDALKRILDDVTSLEVTTYVTTSEQEGPITLTVESARDADNKLIPYKAQLAAHTKIKLDADTLALLPVTQDFVVRKEVYDIHKEHVKMAQETRQAMVGALLEAASKLTNLIG